MATRAEIRQQAMDRRTLWRLWKSSGKTIDDIAAALGCSKQLVHSVTKPTLTERICPSCCQHLQPEVELPVKAKKKK